MDDNDYIKAMVLKMKKKFEKYWGECNLLMAIVVVLDPRYMIMLVEFCFPEIYPRQKLLEIFPWYVVLCMSSKINVLLFILQATWNKICNKAIEKLVLLVMLPVVLEKRLSRENLNLNLLLEKLTSFSQ